MATQQNRADPNDSPRRRRRRKAARPGEIITAALEHFAEQGYANTRLEDVAARAGIAKSTLYLYYDSKAALFAATVEAHVRPTFEHLESLIESFDGNSETLLQLALTRAYEDHLKADNLALMRIMIGEGERFPELRRVFYESKIAAGMHILEAIVQRGVERGEFAAGPATEFPRLLIAPMITAAVWRMSFDEFEPVDIDRWMLAHLRLLMDGIRCDRRGST